MLFASLLSLLLAVFCCLIQAIVGASQDYNAAGVAVKTEPILLDLFHKFSDDSQFTKRGILTIKPNLGTTGATIKQDKLTESQLKAIKEGHGNYYIRAVQKDKVSETLVKKCSIRGLVDFIAVNLSPSNDFISLNLFTIDPECQSEGLAPTTRDFNTTVFVNIGSIGPSPDTATYVKRLEEERQSKLREGKEDNRSFFAKYWIYIVPAVVFLMIFSGPQEPGAR